MEKIYFLIRNQILCDLDWKISISYNWYLMAQKEIQRLEEVLLSKQGYTKKESLRLSELTSSNLVTEMALKTNPAVVSEKERRLKSPSRSTQEVMDMVAGFANQTKK